MQEIIEAIIARINFEKKDLFAILMTKCIKVSDDTTKSTYAVHDNIMFRMDVFFKGFPTFINEYGKDKKYEAGVEALSVICSELGFDMDKEECFILFHLRDLGKFKVRETKLHAELLPMWKQQYKHYALSDQDFSYALKSLMRKKFIEYRKGNLQLNPNVIIRYRTNS